MAAVSSPVHLFGEVVTLLALLLAVSGELKWTLSHPGQPNSPTPRRDPGLGYDPQGNQLVLFGGRDSGKVYLNDTWIYNISSGEWRKLQLGRAPAARRSFVYGSANGKFYIATGEAKPLLDDAWEFDYRTETWQQLPQEPCDSNTGIPQRRYGAAGGIHPNSSLLYVSLGFGDVRYFDTYVYDTIKKCWKSVGPSGSSIYNPSYPHARCLHGGAMTDVDELVIFGGCLGGGGVAGPCPIGDTWVMSKDDSDELEWSLMEYCPIPRIYPAMAALPSSYKGRGAILYGGVEKTGQVLQTHEVLSNEIAVFDMANKEWTLRETQESVSPSRRASAAMATTDTGIYMFGGLSIEDGSHLNELWILTGDVNRTPDISACNRSFFNYIIVHGILMFLGWGVFLQAGAFIARYFRGSSGMWFRLHMAFQLMKVFVDMASFWPLESGDVMMVPLGYVTITKRIDFFVLQIIGLLASIGGFVCAVLSLDMFSNHFTLAHGVIGLIVMILGCLQPINAVIRPHVDAKGSKTQKRKIWEIFHKNLGRLALILALVNITLGLFLGVARRGIYIAYLVFWACLTVAYIIAEVITRVKGGRDSSPNEYAMK